MLKKQRLIAKEPSKYQELSEQDKKVYQQHKQSYIDQYEPDKWKLTVAQLLKYRRPDLVNLFNVDTHTKGDIWMTAAFVKPGTHNFIVSDYRGDKKQDHITNIHECVAGSRLEEIKMNERITKMKSGDAFNKWKSIFSAWPNEGDGLFRQCIEHDVKIWKVTRLIKDQDDYQKTCQVLYKHAKVLQHLFMFLAAKSQFPAIGLLDIGAFCQESQIIDAKFISSTVDR